MTFYGISPNHPLVTELSNSDDGISKFLKDAKKVSSAEADQVKAEKLGYKTKVNIIHPLTKDLIPLWIINYVLMDYGTGAIMGVPAHDERDYEFAKKYNIPISQVIDTEEKLPYSGTGSVINSGDFNGLTSRDAFEEISKKLIKLIYFGMACEI